MSIYKNDDGFFVISSHRMWLPGVYESKKAATYAFRFDVEILQTLQEYANKRAGGVGGIITLEDLRRLTV